MRPDTWYCSLMGNKEANILLCHKFGFKNIWITAFKSIYFLCTPMYFILLKGIYKHYSERGPITWLDGQRGPWYRKVKNSELKGRLNHDVEALIISWWRAQSSGSVTWAQLPRHWVFYLASLCLGLPTYATKLTGEVWTFSELVKGWSEPLTWKTRSGSVRALRCMTRSSRSSSLETASQKKEKGLELII